MPSHPGVGHLFPLLASTRVKGIRFLLFPVDSASPDMVGVVMGGTTNTDMVGVVMDGTTNTDMVGVVMGGTTSTDTHRTPVVTPKYGQTEHHMLVQPGCNFMVGMATLLPGNTKL